MLDDNVLYGYWVSGGVQFPNGLSCWHKPGCQSIAMVLHIADAVSHYLIPQLGHPELLVPIGSGVAAEEVDFRLVLVAPVEGDPAHVLAQGVVHLLGEVRYRYHLLSYYNYLLQL